MTHLELYPSLISKAIAFGLLQLLLATTTFRQVIAAVINDGGSGSVIIPHHRRLLIDDLKEPDSSNIWEEKSCSKKDLAIVQNQTPPLPNGIPTYTVEITNTCLAENCQISNIHLHCGMFSSARLVNPQVFKRLNIDDCLVNDGKPLARGITIGFRYANTFSYQLSVSSLNLNCL